MMENAGYAEHSQQCVVSLAGPHKSAVLSAVKDAIVAWAEQNQPAKTLYHSHIPLILPPDAQESAFPSIHPLLEWGRALFFITPASSCRARNGTEAAGKQRFLGVAKSAQHLRRVVLSESATVADVSWRDDASRGTVSVKRGKHQSTCARHPKAAPQLRL